MALIAVGELLAAERGVDQFRPELDVGLAQVEVVIAFRAHRSRDIWTIGVPLFRVLALGVEFQPIDRFDRNAGGTGLKKESSVTDLRGC